MNKYTPSSVSASKDPVKTHSISANQKFSHNPPKNDNKHCGFEKMDPLDLPPASDHKSWKNLSDDLTPILESKFPDATIKNSDLDELCNNFNSVVREYLIKKCGIKQKKQNKQNKSKTKSNKHFSNRYYKLRAQKRKLRSEFRKAKREHAPKHIIYRLLK